MIRPRSMRNSCLGAVGAAVVLGLLVAGCVEPPSPQGPPAVSATDADDRLPPCGKPPSPDPDPPPPGAVLPPAARITAVREQPPVVQLNGYVQSTPAALRTWVEARPNLDIVSEHAEPGEVQLLVTDGTWKTFIKASAICEDASLLAEVIAPEDSGAVIPTPEGSPAP